MRDAVRRACAIVTDACEIVSRTHEIKKTTQNIHVTSRAPYTCVQESRLSALLGKALSAHQRDVAVLKDEAEEGSYDFISSLYFVIVSLRASPGHRQYRQMLGAPSSVGGAEKGGGKK